MNNNKKWTPSVNAAAAEVQPQEEQAELQDPQKELRNDCGKKREISKLFDTLQECNERVNSRENTRETCEQELFDYVHAVDHCVAKTLFTKLV